MGRKAPPLRLYTFTISHFSEKIRWLLDSANLPYEERPLTPGLHMPKALWLSRRGTSVPILAEGREHVQDSRRIVRWLSARRAPLPLLSPDPKLREAALKIEAAQDEVGTAVLRVVYERLIDDPDLLFELWTLDASATQRRLLRAALPALRPAFRRRFGIDPRRVAAARATVERRLDELDRWLAGGGRYQVGGRFGIADLTTCALLAPLASPDQHPIYGAARARDAMPEPIQAWRSRPALQWVRETYRLCRPLPRPDSGFATARQRLDQAGRGG